MKTKQPDTRRTPPDVEKKEQQFPPSEPAIEEFVGEKADWSEDISQSGKENRKKRRGR